MAVSPVIANAVQVRLLWAFSGNGAINVLHGLAGGTVVVNQALANSLGSAIKAAFTANLASLVSTGSGLVRVGVRDIRIPAGFEYLDTGSTALGTDVAESLPVQTAAVITLRTGKAGKSFRGRVYLGGFTETANGAAGVAGAPVATQGVAFMQAVDAAMLASGIPLAVASRPAERYTVVRTTFHNDGTTSSKTVTQGPARPGGIEDVTLIQSRTNIWETQRRRANGRGSLPT